MPTLKIAENGIGFLNVKASPATIALARGLEGRRFWMRNGGLRIEPTEYNLNKIKEAIPDIEIIKPQQKTHHKAETNQYRPKTELYPHQKRALEKMRKRATFALFLEQGTGKTKVAIDRAGELWAAGEISGVLVVAQKGVHRQWVESQLPQHFGGEWSGAYWQNGRFINTGPDRGLVWRAINFDAVKTPKGEAACVEFIKEHDGRVMIIADETQQIKNPMSKRHKALEKLKRHQTVDYRIIMTGTPIAKDLTDEWAQLRWLDESIIGIKYLTTFRAQYCIMGGYENREVIGHKNIEEFRNKAEPAVFRATKEELGILPKSYRRWVFDLSQEQQRIIRDMKRNLIAQIDSGQIVSADTATVALMRIQQVSNGFIVDDSGNVVVLNHNPRLEALLEVLEAFPGKTIIWARFQKDIALIATALKAQSIGFVEYYGKTTSTQRAENLDKFLNDDKVRIFLSNPQVGGTGLNLQGECRHAIYYSNSFSAIDRWQSEDRIHRIGTIGPVVYTDLIGKGSIDLLILSNLARKKSISDLALGEIRKLLGE